MLPPAAVIVLSIASRSSTTCRSDQAAHILLALEAAIGSSPKFNSGHIHDPVGHVDAALGIAGARHSRRPSRRISGGLRVAERDGDVRSWLAM